MSAKNSCIFIGNLGRDVEVRVTQSGTSIASFSLPVTSGYGDNIKTTWLRCTLFGKRAEGGLMQYLVKGTQVSVTGEISLNTYTNKDGIEKSSLELKIDDIALIGKKSDNQQGQQQQSYQQAPQQQQQQQQPQQPQQQQNPFDAPPIDDSGIPF